MNRCTQWLPRWLYEQTNSSSSAALPPTQLDDVLNWAGKVYGVSDRYEALANNGLLSLLEKEFTVIADLLCEGEKMVSDHSCTAAVAQTIASMVKPRLERLQKTHVAALGKYHENSALKEEDKSLEKKWADLQLPSSVLEKHADCARFLIESKLAFAIVGYRESTGNSHIHDLKLDTDGHPMIRMQGRFVRWETLKQELVFDPQTDKIKSRHYAGSLAQAWSYFNEGLEPTDRFEYDHIRPVHELSQAEYDQVLALAKKFYETNPEKDVGIPKDCVVQFSTTYRRQGIPDHHLLDNAVRQYPVHIMIRVITADKKVYSFGYQMPEEDKNFVLSSYLSTFMATADAKISLLDYEEFRAHEGRTVTSIPLTTQRAQNIFKLVEELKGKQLRFQYLRQNCSALTHEVMKCAGYEVDIRTKLSQMFYGMLPSWGQILGIGEILAKVERCFERIRQCAITYTPIWIQRPVEWIRSIVWYLPEKLTTVACNLFIWKAGGGKKRTPLRDGMQEEEFSEKRGIQGFSTLIRSWTDLFKDQTSVVDHSALFIDWQKAQKSTFIDPGSPRPRFSILPKPLA